MYFIQNNLERLKESIDETARKIGRKGQDITLVVVTKTRSIDEIRETYKCGQRVIGENKIQEAKSKYQSLSDLDLQWHLIGHLQRNKVKDAIEIFSMIQSVDSIRLAEEIDKRCEQRNKIMDILIEVNVSGEESKYGFRQNEVLSELETISNMKNIKVLGLMTMAPFEINPEDTRPVFSGLRELRDKVATQNIPNVEMKYLSMGMTNDYMVAIEEGSNMVRIGTAVFQKI